MAVRQPEVRLHLLEQEPAEALGLLAADEIDLALTYDYNLAPARFGRGLHGRPLTQTRWAAPRGAWARRPRRGAGAAPRWRCSAGTGSRTGS